MEYSHSQSTALWAGKVYSSSTPEPFLSAAVRGTLRTNSPSDRSNSAPGAIDDLAYHRDASCAAMSSSLSVHTLGAIPMNRRQITSMTDLVMMMSSSADRRSRWSSFIVIGWSVYSLMTWSAAIPFLVMKRSRTCRPLAVTM